MRFIWAEKKSYKRFSPCKTNCIPWHAPPRGKTYERLCWTCKLSGLSHRRENKSLPDEYAFLHMWFPATAVEMLPRSRCNLPKLNLQEGLRHDDERMEGEGVERERCGRGRKGMSCGCGTIICCSTFINISHLTAKKQAEGLLLLHR